MFNPHPESALNLSGGFIAFIVYILILTSLMGGWILQMIAV